MNDKKNLMSFVDSDKQTQFVSGLILSLCGFILFWQFSKKEFTGTKLLLFRIGFCCVFLVFCINISTIYTISKHLSIIYDKLTVETEKDVYQYHINNTGKLNFMTMMFRFSLALLVFAVFIIMISKHDIVNNNILIFLVVSTMLSVLSFML